jgi:hypothetical protein
MTTATIVRAVPLAGLFPVTGADEVAALPSLRPRAAHVFSVDAHSRIGAVAATTGVFPLTLGATVAHSRSKDTGGAMAPAVSVLGLDVAFLAFRRRS